MRSPLANPNNHHHHHHHHHHQQLCSSKPQLTATATATATATSTTPTNSSSLSNNSPGPQFFCEPTSVLDLRRSPSPVLGGSFPDDQQCGWDLDHPHHLLMDDWDPTTYSMMLGFGDHNGKDNASTRLLVDDLDDSLKTLNPQFPDSQNPNPIPNSPPPLLLNHDDFIAHNASPNPQFMNLIAHPQLGTPNLFNLDFDSNSAASTLLDRLVRAAEAVESNDLQLAQAILARLNQHQHQHQPHLDKPLLRSALHFKEALQSILSASSHQMISSSSSENTIQKIRAYKSFSEISPITMFANFTANQALLETLDGAPFLHIVDFDVGLGGQWASFMQEIATKATSRAHHPPSLRITAVVSEDSSVEAKLVKDNLHQFALELGIHFQIDFVFFRSFELLHFNSLRILNSEVLAVNLSPAILRHLGGSSPPADFLRFLRRISPRITVFVDSDGWRDAGGGGGASFRRNFASGVQFYSALLESLDAVNNGNLDLVRRIERFLIQPRIFAAVAAAAGGCVVPWRELFSGAGMSPVAFSQFTDTQAEWLVRRTQVRNFHVAKRQGELLLCWHGRVLVSTSAWRC